MYESSCSVVLKLERRFLLFVTCCLISSAALCLDIESMLEPTRIIVRRRVAINTPNMVIARLARNFLNPIYFVLPFFETYHITAEAMPARMTTPGRYP